MSTTDFERDQSKQSLTFQIELLRAEEHRLTRLLADAVSLAAELSGIEPAELLVKLAEGRGFNLTQAALLDDLEAAVDTAVNAQDFLFAYDRLERTRERMSGRRRVR